MLSPPFESSPGRVAPQGALAGYLARLEACADVPLVWVHAAPGSGKTCGLLAWLQRSRRPYYWLGVEAADSRSHSCALRLRATLIGEQDPERAAYEAWLTQDPIAPLECLLEQLEDSLTGPVWLIVDGLHVISKVHKHPIWSTLLLRASAKLRVVVTTQEPVPRSWARGLVNRQIEEITQDELRWSLQDLQLWLARWGVSEGVLNEVELERILARSRGWGAGVEYLVKAQLRILSGPSSAFCSLWSKMQQCTGRGPLDATWRRLRGIVAIQSSLHASLLGSVDPSGVLVQTLQQMAHASLLVQATGGLDELTFEVHPMLADVLEVTAQTEPPHPEDRLCFAQAFLAHHRPLEALVVLGQSQRWVRFVQVLDACAKSLSDHIDLERLAPYLMALPNEVAGTFRLGWLDVLRGLSLRNRDLMRAHALVQARARSETELVGDLDWRACALCSDLMLTMMRHRSHQEIQDCVRRCSRLIEQTVTTPIPVRRRLELLLTTGIATLTFVPEHPSTWAWLEEIFQFSDKDFRTPKIASLTTTLALRCGQAGDVDLARLLYERVAWANIERAHPMCRLAAQVARLALDYFSGRFSKIVEEGSKVEKVLQEQALFLWREEVQSLVAFASLCLGQSGYLDKNFQQSPSAGSTEWTSSSTNMKLVQIAESLGKGDVAPKMHEQQQHMLEQVDHSGYYFYRIAIRATIAFEQAEAGRFEGAKEQLEVIDRLLIDPEPRATRWSRQWASAYLKLATGDKDGCEALLRELLSQTRKAGIFAHGVHLQRGYRELLAFALERNIETDHVVDMIQRTQFYPMSNPCRVWPAKYELSVLGSFVLKVDGQDDTASFRQTRNRFELLTALVWMGGSKVDEGLLMQAVWGHVRNDPQARLRQAIRRLRRSLGHAESIVWEDGQVSLHPQLWSLDLWQLLERLDTLDVSNKEQAQRTLLGIERRVEGGFVGATPLPASLAHKQMGLVLPPRLRSKLEEARAALA